MLFSEAVQFNTSEIRAALSEDFPTLDIQPGPMADVLELDCDTASFITAPLMMGDSGKDAFVVTLVRLPGYGTWGFEALAPGQRILVPDLEQRLHRNATYICVSVGVNADVAITDKFRAARLSSCLAAVFARLPVAVAAYWQNGDHFLTPEQVCDMAKTSMGDDWPVFAWIGLDIHRDPKSGHFGVLTKGLRSFTGYEISHAAAPLQPGDAAAFTLSAATMAVEYGNRFNDGDTLGAEGQSRQDSYRIRHVPKGTEGSICDVKLLVHPQSRADHEALAGPILSRPPPPGVDNSVPPRPGFFKRIIRGARAS